MPKGRPSKFRRDIIRTAEKLAGLGIDKDSLALYLGINRSTLFRWEKKNNDLCNAIKRGHLNAKITVTTALFNAAKKGNLTACIFYLCNRAPDLWKSTAKITQVTAIAHPDSNTVDSDTIQKMTPEQRVKFRQALVTAGLLKDKGA